MFSLFFSLCGWRSGAFTFASVLSWRHTWRRAYVFVTCLKRQTRMWTSGGIAFVKRRTRDVMGTKKHRPVRGRERSAGGDPLLDPLVVVCLLNSQFL